MIAAAVAAIAAMSAAPAPVVDLYTMGQGDQLFERFGHAAICVQWPADADARCYNYGTTDFGSPPARLGWQFLRGTARFWVSVWPRERMIAQYVARDRSVWRQRLPLTDDQARELARRLAHDAREENRYYAYHHFRDNCATRVRDHIDAVTGGALSRDNQRPIGVTYRELGRRGLAELTPILVASVFLVGRFADVQPTGYEAMFLPDLLRAGVAERLGAAPEAVYLRRGPAFPTEGNSVAPWLLAIAAATVAPVAAARALGRGVRAGSWASAAALTALGTAVWTVALAAGMPELRWNEVALVLWPSDALLATRRGRAYGRLRVVALALVSAARAVGVLRQPLWLVVLIPLGPALIAALAPLRGETESRRSPRDAAREHAP
ncbi:MAG: DUF4105 domain-containing protein [Deltaproteobacteria bacterium]|nr:MAG: DUF4105 domain-containing protein [Deltaproteobacteria bacterium]